MLINRVFANNPIKKVVFESGYNAVVAESTKESSDKDSRNGLGKTLLIEIINFCLGSGASENLQKEELRLWSFGIEVEIHDEIYTFERSTAKGNVITVTGNLSKWPRAASRDDVAVLKISDFNLAMGMMIFDLSPSDYKKLSYRNLMSYFMRTDNTAFATPFKHFSTQPARSTKVCTSFLLGLNWEYADAFSALKDREEILKNIEKATANGDLGSEDSTGELEAERIRIQAKLTALEEQLSSFQVLDQYYDTQKEADSLTKQIHKLLNSLNISDQTMRQYVDSIASEKDVSIGDVEQIYEQAGIYFNETLKKQLAEVEEFHKTVVKNRRQYLEEEITQLKAKKAMAQSEIAKLSDKKRQLMQLLDSHGALEEYSRLQEIVTLQRQKYEDIVSRINRLNEAANSLSKLNVETENLLQAMRQDYSERLPAVANAIRLFNENSEFLYSEPGTLTAGVTKKAGYQFKVDIKRAGSGGVGNMKVFCYDLMLAELWSVHRGKSIPLIHDSRIFDGVDERQVAKALELASIKAEQCGFQYICTINSDAIPRHLFSEEFSKSFEASVKVRYNDKSPNETLLGFRF